MDFEFQPLPNNKAWTFIPFPPNCKPMNCKWIFNIKYNVDGSIVKHKVCLMARGFTQVEHIDFNETFSHVLQIKSIQAILVVTTINDLEVHQINVKTTFSKWRSFRGNIYM
jgi:hypothetical protein